jgi:hypothetical protein
MGISGKCYGRITVSADPVLRKPFDIIERVQVHGLPVIIAQNKGIIISFNIPFDVVKFKLQAPATVKGVNGKTLLVTRRKKLCRAYIGSIGSLNHLRMYSHGYQHGQTR